MLDYKKLEEIGKDAGFTVVAPLDVSTIQVMQEVRDMCAANTCGQYGKNWCCPPGVGTLEECDERIHRYTSGIIVQTVGEMEDSWDVETMMETEANHKKFFDAMRRELLADYPGMLSMGAGTCTRCKSCTYPDAPCRMKDNTFGSMEAYGLLVSAVCTANNVPYNHGPNTIAYTGCFLLE